MGIRVAVCLWVMLWVTGLAGAAEAGRPVSGEAKQAFLQAWGERLRAMQSLHMTFTQVKHLRQLRQPLRAAGELWLRGETLLYVLKDTAGATELAMRLEPGRVRMYYPQLQTLEVFDLGTGRAPVSMVPFLTRDPDALLRDYDSTLVVEAGFHILTLVPKDAASPLAELRFRLEDFRLRAFQQVEKSGNRLVMHITTFEPNLAISDAQLELHVPEGTNVTRPLR
jgi:outer membrane lipoprotein-sorting protein